MAMDVVAATRAESDDVSAWGHSFRIGLYTGITLLLLALMGVLSLFNNRNIIVDVLSLAYAMLGLVLIGTGIAVAKRGLFGNPVSAVVGAAVAGAIGAGFLAALAIFMTLVNARFIFINLEPKLLKLLTFSMQPPAMGAAAMIGLGAVVAAGGALLVSLPSMLRRPIAAALIGAGAAGLFQELIRITLVNNLATKWLHDLLYTYTGLTLQGAVIMAVASAAGTILWDTISGSMRMAGVDMTATKQRMRLPLMIACLVIIGLFPLYGGNFVGQVFLMVGFFVLMGMGLNLEVGLAGLLDLGFVAFYAVGAYVTALLMADSEFSLHQNFGWEWANMSYWMAMPIAILASVIVGILFGVPVLKVRGDYLAVATLGLGEIVRIIVLSDAAAPLLGGAKGVLQIPRPEVIGFGPLNSQVSLFYVVFFGSLLAAYIAWRLENSRLGRAWTAIRDDEDVAQALGINLINVKLLAYGLGAAFAGFAGSIFAVLVGSIFPHSFQLIISINVLALLIVGGMGSLPGVVLGSAVLIGLPEMLREFGEYRFLFYGLAIIAVTRLKPEGLWPSAARQREIKLDAEAAAIERSGIVAEKAA
jgi:branched-chain amino acid transport system permease protein